MQVSEITNAVQVTVGFDHKCAVLTSGTIECWGYGQLGDDTTMGSPTPVAVSGITNAVEVTAADEFVGINFSHSHTCALLNDETVDCWGYNGYGQLGNGNTTGSTTPVQVSGIP